MDLSIIKRVSRGRVAILREKVADFPQNPGVYFFRGEKGKLLYIGKATNLRSRVGSYFIPSPLPSPEGRGGIYSRPIEVMIQEVVDVDFQETDSVLEALILESNLIRKHQPKYNVLGKDDKSFSYFVITKEEFSRVMILRKTDIEQFTVNSSQLIVQEKKSVNQELLTKNIYGPYTSKNQMQVALKIIRKIFPYHSNKQKTEKGCLDFQIGLCPGPYAGAISKEDYQKNIRGIKMILDGKKKNLVKTLEKEMNAAAKKNEFEKAAILRNKIFALQHIRDVALISREDNGAVETRHASSLRVEAYDISNISGTNAVGSMVVFAVSRDPLRGFYGDNGQSDKSQYRKFKIKTVIGSDDVGMMREVLSRRFHNDWPQPDLVLLDGGVGHLNMAEKLIHKEFGLEVGIVAIAKGVARKNLDISRDSNLRMHPNLRIENILKNNNLVKSIMDEAHRFAIGYHRKLRRKSALE